MCKSLTSAPLAVRMSDSAPISASTDSLKDLAWAASARLLSRDDSWCSAMASACSSRLGRRFESPTSSQAVVHGVAALMTCLYGCWGVVLSVVSHARRRRRGKTKWPLKMFGTIQGMAGLHKQTHRTQCNEGMFCPLPPTPRTTALHNEPAEQEIMRGNQASMLCLREVLKGWRVGVELKRSPVNGCRFRLQRAGVCVSGSSSYVLPCWCYCRTHGREHTAHKRQKQTALV